MLWKYLISNNKSPAATFFQPFSQIKKITRMIFFPLVSQGFGTNQHELTISNEGSLEKRECELLWMFWFVCILEDAKYVLVQTDASTITEGEL